MIVHHTATISPGAVIADDVTIGPGCVIGAEVRIGSGCVLHGHCYVQGQTEVGEGNEFFPFTSIGYPPQDPKYKGEKTRVVIGARNIFRENVTVNAGTVSGGGVTRIGNQNLFMAYSHAGHDSQVGDGNMFVNHVSLAGHVEIGNSVILSGYVGVTQFVRIGSYSMIGAGCIVGMDVPPFIRGKAKDNNRVSILGLNSIGLERKGFTKESIAKITEVFRLVYKQNLTVKEAVAAARDKNLNDDHVEYFLRFIESSEKGIAR